MLDQGLPRYRSTRRGKIERKLQMVERFNTWLERQDYTPNTRRTYCNIAREASAFFGRKPFRSVTPLDISDFL
jgi:hypothetical protein